MIRFKQHNRNWNPWRELEQFQNEMNQFFSGAPGTVFTRHREEPAINAWLKDDELTITADLPGVHPDNLDLTVTKNAITIAAEHASEELDENQTYHRSERLSDSFSRTLEVPFEIDPEKTEAVYENGVLTLKVHRHEDHKPRKVKVTAEA